MEDEKKQQENEFIQAINILEEQKRELEEDNIKLAEEDGQRQQEFEKLQSNNKELEEAVSHLQVQLDEQSSELKGMTIAQEHLEVLETEIESIVDQNRQLKEFIQSEQDSRE